MGDIAWGPVIAGMGVSLLVAAALVVTRKWHGHLSFDSDSGVQRVHQGQVPRVGGLALLAGLLAVWALMDGAVAGLWGLLWLAAIPAVLAGLLEDVTKRVGVKARLMATVLSGVIFVLLSGYAVTRVELALLDALLALPVLALLFSGFAIGGIANAVNLIDGFHGLAAGTVILALLAFALVAGRAGDSGLAQMALVMAAVMAGFMVVNFPLGRLFLGDGGAFLSGYMLAVMAVMLPARNPGVSPWVSLVILGYPVVETAATALRRGKKARWGDSERAHLHHLVHMRLAQVARIKTPTLQNALTSVWVWVLPLSSLIFVAIVTPTTAQAMAYLAALVAVYAFWYRRMAAGVPAVVSLAANSG